MKLGYMQCKLIIISSNNFKISSLSYSAHVEVVLNVPCDKVILRSKCISIQVDMLISDG